MENDEENRVMERGKKKSRNLVRVPARMGEIEESEEFRVFATRSVLPLLSRSLPGSSLPFGFSDSIRVDVEWPRLYQG